MMGLQRMSLTGGVVVALAVGLILLGGRPEQGVAVESTNLTNLTEGAEPGGGEPESAELQPHQQIEALVGSWQWHSPGGSTMTLTFTSPRRLTIVLMGENSPQLAQEVLYQVDTSVQPMQMDLTLNDAEQFQTIFRLDDLANPIRLEIELSQLGAGQPRPPVFTPEVLVFERLSGPPALPSGLTIVPYEQRVSREREAQARAYLEALTQAQAAYYQSQAHYASVWEEFVVGLTPETRFYTFAIVPPVQASSSAGDDRGELPTFESQESNPSDLQPSELSASDLRHNVAITATAKVEGIRSYTTILVASEVEGKLQTLTKTCVTPQPSQQPPQVPVLTFATQTLEEIPCLGHSEEWLP